MRRTPAASLPLLALWNQWRDVLRYRSERQRCAVCSTRCWP